MEEIGSENKSTNLNKYWETCNNIGRCITVVCILSSTIFQTKAIFDPLNKTHRKVNMWYQLGTFLSAILIYLSYKRPNGARYSYVAFIYTILRFLFRMIDIEETRNFIPQENFFFHMLYQILVIMCMLCINIFLHGNQICNPYISTLLMWFAIFCCFKTAFDDFDQKDFKYLLQYLPSLICASFFPFIAGRVIPSII